ncbi:MAG: methyltransferase domain-containing protein [Deltaproteobacteria bacterium]|nr:methyltransferase domain-containing protein [Deltaproteobacteria bacterium]
MFEVAEAYERQRGRSSKILAPLFVDYVGVRGEVLDVGCGTGALTFAIARDNSVSKIVGVDLSEGFLAYGRSKTDDPRISFKQGDAQSLPFPDDSFDSCLALLVMAFIPDAPKAAREMRRVTRPGGVVATAMWDNTGGNDLNQSLWEAAIPLDPKAPQDKDRPGSYGTAEDLTALWAGAGLTNFAVKNIVFPCGFDSFDDFWLPLTEGQGPAGAYLARLSVEHRAALRERLRQNLFGNRPDGPFSLNAKAWAVRGTVPAV